MSTAAPAAPLLERLATGGPHLSIGMLTADLARLGEELTVIESAGAELVHVDVMDGTFLPQLTFGAPIVKAIRTSMLVDVHLLVSDPLAKVADMVTAGADVVTFHVEGAAQPHRVLQVLSDLRRDDGSGGPLRGIALNPSTPVGVIEPLLDLADLVVILSIDPGWSGQKFQPSTARRVEEARRLIEASGRTVLVGIDGGVTRDNIAAVAGMGADIIVTGSAVFDGGDAAANARYMLEAARRDGR
jgi:ribulose-phosphate 3-epimerase